MCVCVFMFDLQDRIYNFVFGKSMLCILQHYVSIQYSTEKKLRAFFNIIYTLLETSLFSA